MKHLSKGLLIIFTSIASLHLHAFTSEIINIKLNDGEVVTTRLCLPEQGERERQTELSLLFMVLGHLHISLNETALTITMYLLRGFVIKVQVFSPITEEKILSENYSEGLQKLFDTSVEI